jgi:hypothetical protein
MTKVPREVVVMEDVARMDKEVKMMNMECHQIDSGGNGEVQGGRQTSTST